MLKKLQAGSSTFLHRTWISVAGVIKDSPDSPEHCEHEKNRKDCKLCPDEFRLELLTDIDMLLTVEKGIRGGITQTVKRYAKANNKYMKDLHNLDEKSIYLQHLDANNLYGWPVIKNLPTHRFLWKKAEDFTPEKNR